MTKVIEMVRVDVDAEQRRHLAVLLAGALGAAERGVLDQIPEGGQQHRGDGPRSGSGGSDSVTS